MQTKQVVINCINKLNQCSLCTCLCHIHVKMADSCSRICLNPNAVSLCWKVVGTWELRWKSFRVLGNTILDLYEVRDKEGLKKMLKGASKGHWNYFMRGYVIFRLAPCKDKFMLLTNFVQQDNLHRWTPLLWISKREWLSREVRVILYTS